MTSDSDTSILALEGPKGAKPKRRSSIFRPDEAVPTTLRISNEITAAIYPPNYIDKLKEENQKWEESFLSVKADYLESKKKAYQQIDQPKLSLKLPNNNNYLKKAENFCNLVNNIIELHENAMNYRSITTLELEKQVETTSKKISEKLNMDA